MKEQILDRYSNYNFLSADGFDDAIIGVEEQSMRLIYSVSKCIEILMKFMSEAEAMDHFSFNVMGSDIGEKMPIWCYDNF